MLNEVWNTTESGNASSRSRLLTEDTKLFRDLLGDLLASGYFGAEPPRRASLTFCRNR
jgi:hypothetical protein